MRSSSAGGATVSSSTRHGPGTAGAPRRACHHDSGRPLASRLPWRIGLELRAVVAGGLAILDRIDAVDGDVFRSRPVLSPRDWLRVGWRTLVPQGGTA